MPDSMLRARFAVSRRSSFVRSLAAVIVVLPMTLIGCRLSVEPEQDLSLEPYVAQMLEASAAAWN